ncbi:MAG TPA: hypothetical protein VJO52_16715 [Gemmatimonadaceae bacterium]|nr:hypothetical protein [Gemmatimonadaceae bacterium]
MTRVVTRDVRGALACAALLAAAPAARAQAPLGGVLGVQTGVTFEQWHFGCCTGATGAATSVRSASEWTVPITAFIPAGPVAFDVYSAWMHGSVTLRGAGAPSPTLSGLTDTYVRGAVHVGGDALLATVGVNVPTGKTSLTTDQLGVLEVLGAPALRYQTPVLGTGWGGTAGLVYTVYAGTWSWGFGTSYEYRGQYTPAQAQALGLGSGDFDLRPGQAIRVSIGSDGLVGQSDMSVSLASTFYTQDHVALSAGGTPPAPITLGPMFTGEWQLRTAAGAMRDLTLFAFDRYRMQNSRDGARVAGTDGNELEFGASGSIPLGSRTAVVAGLRGRWHTGLSVNTSLPTAGIVSGGGDIGLSWLAGPFALHPAIGGEIGRLDTGPSTISVNKLEASFTISAR